MLLKLITQTPITEGLDFLVEETSKDKPAKLIVSGIYMVAEEKNRNNRIYSREEMAEEVERFNKELVSNNRALGELEHPQSANVNSERACHLITELKMDGNLVRGKSKVLNTPLGAIMRSLIMDGVKMGMSSRALGQLEDKGGVNYVKNMKLITIDAVADPSAPGAFINGILESKNFIVKQNGGFEEYYDVLQAKLSSLPKKDVDLYLREQIMQFIKNIK
jgi:Prohead core protein serine protease